MWHSGLNCHFGPKDPISSMGSSLRGSASDLPLASVPGKAGDDGLSAWAPATHMGDQAGVSRSWLLLGPALAVVATWGVAQWMEPH